MNKMKYRIILFYIIVSFIIWLTPSPVLAQKKFISIGAFIPTHNNKAGKAALKGLRIAVNRVNKKNGIKGRPLKLVIGSSDVPWNRASNELTNLIYKEEVIAIIGGLDASSAHLAAQVITRAKGETVFINSWTGEDTLNRIGIPWFFSITPDDRIQADIIINEIFFARDISSIAILVEDTFDAQSALRSFMKQPGPGRAVSEYNISETRGMNKFLLESQKNTFDAIVLFSSPGKAAEIARLLKNNQIKTPIIGHMSVIGEKLLKMDEIRSGSTVVVVPNIYNNIKQLPLELQNINNILPVTLYFYDAVMIIVEALKNMDSSDITLEQSLLKISFNGVTGRIRFNKNRARDIEPVLTDIRKLTQK